MPNVLILFYINNIAVKTNKGSQSIFKHLHRFIVVHLTLQIAKFQKYNNNNKIVVQKRIIFYQQYF